MMKLFDTPKAIGVLERGAEVLGANEDSPKSVQLGEMLRIIAKNAEAFDKNCQVNLEWIGTQTLGRIQELGPRPSKETIDLISALIYRFMVEYDLSIKNELSMEVQSFMRSVRNDLDTFADDAKSQIEFARQEMSMAIVKRIINTEEFGLLRNIPEVALTVDRKIEEWKGSLNATEQNASRLGDLLKKHTQAFNFVGLHEGFSDLAVNIKKELVFAQFGIGVFGLLVLIPSGFDLWLLFSRNIDVSSLKIPTLIAASVSIVALTLLFLYFFRIALRKADSCRAQLIQVRLRMSLCRFIQSYADYSTEIKSKNADALVKFENLIFSGIVNSDEKLPSTFDGIEQLTALAKTVKGK